MANYSEYLIESILILMVFYFSYLILFHRMASFKINRLFLLTGIILSSFFPFFDFSAPATIGLQPYIQLKTIVISASNQELNDLNTFYSLTKILNFCYWAGVIIFSLKFLYQFISMLRLFIGSETVRDLFQNRVYTKKEHPVFSFLTFVFIGSNSEHNKDLKIILNHEEIHIVQKHTIDLLLLELLAIVQWFNPIIWHYRKLVKENHEYLADRGVISKGIPDETYQELLLGNYKSLKLGFANSFNHSLTFKRLVMMKKVNSIKSLIVRLTLVVPVIIIAVYFISCSKGEQFLINKSDPLKTEEKKTPEINPSENPSISKEEKQLDSIAKDNIIYESFAIDERPYFPGGDMELINYIAKNTVYPEAAIKDSIQGTVYVRFVVKKTGKTEAKEIMKKVDPLLEEEAIRVVNSLPDWIPGKKNGKAVDVWFIVPVKFKLQ